MNKSLIFILLVLTIMFSGCGQIKSTPNTKYEKEIMGSTTEDIINATVVENIRLTVIEDQVLWDIPYNNQAGVLLPNESVVVTGITLDKKWVMIEKDSQHFWTQVTKGMRFNGSILGLEIIEVVEISSPTPEILPTYTPSTINTLVPTYTPTTTYTPVPTNTPNRTPLVIITLAPTKTPIVVYPTMTRIFTPIPLIPTLNTVLNTPVPNTPIPNTPIPNTPIPPVVQVVCPCGSDSLNCSDFQTHVSAQACFNYCVAQGAGDIHRLDRNNDNNACESLP